jgi:F-type H+-transporting ATPase subunit delta
MTQTARTGDAVLAERYATALLALAEEKGALEQVAADLTVVIDLFDRDASLENFLAAPHVLEERKAELARTALGGNVSRVFLDFLLFLLEKHRFNQFRQIATRYQELREERQGIVRAQVVTAVDLPPAEALRLKAKLEQKTKKKILLKPVVDPEILGGMIVKLKHQIIDRSIAQQLVELKEQLLAVKVH